MRRDFYGQKRYAFDAYDWNQVTFSNRSKLIYTIGAGDMEHFHKLLGSNPKIVMDCLY